MSLSERKRRILRAVVDDYIRTAEPVGSSYISNSHDFGISSATIRNEMADLEESGYLDKPHTSAGRVPSIKGYRVYVDELMQQYTLTMREIDAVRGTLRKKYIELSSIVNDISSTISRLTNYTALVSTPTSAAVCIKNIRFVAIDAHTFVMIVVTGEGMVRNTTVKQRDNVNVQVLERLGNYLNSVFCERNLCDISLEFIETQKNLIPMPDEILSPVFDFLREIFTSGTDFKVIRGGEANILNYPEFKNIERTKGYFDLIKSLDGDFIKTALSDTGDDISILIGDENPFFKDLGLSMVLSKYKIGGEAGGGIVIIGPTRMDYSKVVAMLNFLTGNLNKYLNDGDD